MGDRRSFQNIKEEGWLEKVREEMAGGGGGIAVVGNRVELQMREVEKEEAELFALENDLDYFEVSAEKDIGITQLFNHIGKAIVKQIKKLGLKNILFGKRTEKHNN